MTNICYPFATLGLSKASLKLHCMNYSFSLLFQNPDLLQIPSISFGGKQKTDAHCIPSLLPIKECHNSFLRLLPLLLFVPLLCIPQYVFCPKLSSSGKVAGH